MTSMTLHDRTNEKCSARIVPEFAGLRLSTKHFRENDVFKLLEED